MTFITRPLLEMIRDQSAVSRDGFHSVDHWVRVLANGRKLTKTTGAVIDVVELFSVFHDSRRLNEGDDPEHGLRGARFAQDMRGTWFNISDGDMGLLFEACEKHSDGLIDADVTVQTCWDADRLDLGRVGITPSAERLCTDAARDPEMYNWAHNRALSAHHPEDHEWKS